MLSKVESSKNGSEEEDSNSGQLLLRDIEAISKALYLPNAASSLKGLISPSDNHHRSKSTGKTRFLGSTSNTKTDKKSSIWNWKKPLKALSHIRNRKFSCCFYLHVHSIEGLPSNFNNIGLCVHWKRKEEVLRTRPSRVDQGMAEFEETLRHRCSVYGHRSGPEHSAKYEEKLFLVYPCIVGAYDLDIGKHWIDLTKLLPLTLEELGKEKSSGKWTTSFKLTGKAKGATLNVSFGYSVVGNTSIEADSNTGATLFSNSNQNRSSAMENVASSDHRKLRRVGSVPNMVNHGSHLSSQSMNVKVFHDVFPNPGLGLSRSINLLYQKLDETKWGNSKEVDEFSEQLQSQLKPDILSKSAEEHFGNECDDIEFTVIDQGIELSMKEQLRLEESSDQTFDGFVVETIPAPEIVKDDAAVPNEGMKENSKDDDFDVYNNNAEANGCKYVDNDVWSKESTMEELKHTFDSLFGPKSMDLNSQLTLSEILAHEIHMQETYLSENENYMEKKSNYKATRMVKSLSLDDVAESISSDFLNMLGAEHSLVGLSSDSDPESPRERLLRQFEKEALASGNFIFNTDAQMEEVEFDCDAVTTSQIGDFPDDLDLSLIIQAAEQEQKRASPSLMSKRKAKMLENLETEALMQEWGLNEMAFQNSPRCNSGGFGSPIYLPYEEPVYLPPLGEGVGPVFKTKNGGFLRSMNPSLFKNAKNGGSLIMQVSTQVVLPAELGSGIIEILQRLASVGIEQLSMQVNNLMPLEDISGKTMGQVAWEAASILEVPESERMTSLHPDSEVEQDSFSKRKEAEGLHSVRSYNNLHSNSIGSEMDSAYVSLEDFVPLAMDKIEDLSIEGLRIQSGMSREEAPSSMYPHALNSANLGDSLTLEELQQLDVSESGIEVNNLMGLSMTLDEWLRLDAGIFSDEDHMSEHTVKILAAHHAKCTDLFGGRLTRERIWGKASGRKCGLLGDNLTIALMVLLRDPFRNYEPVGASMLALFQVERVYAPPKHEVHSLLEVTINRENDGQDEPVVKEDISDERHEEKKEEEEDSIPQFKITEVHVVGLNTEPVEKQLWGTITQQQSGYRWLLASGMGKTNKHPSLKSKAILKVSSLAMAKKKPRDALWSISSCVQGTGGKWKELAALNLHKRNPDVIFLDEAIRI